MARVTDRRVRQFWDPDHLVATSLSEFAKQKPGQPEPFVQGVGIFQSSGGKLIGQK